MSTAALMEAVFDVFGAGLYAIDTDGVIQLANLGAQRLLGYEEAELIGRQAHELFHFIDATGKPRSATRCPLVGAARSGERSEDAQDVFIRKDGSVLPVAWNAAPVKEEGAPVGAVILFYDTSSRVAEAHRHDAELAEARRASDEAARGAERTAFLADATAALISTLDVDEALTRLARILVPRFADWCVIDLLESDHEVRRVTVAHREPALIPRLGVDVAVRFRIPESSDATLARVLRGAPPSLLSDFHPSAWTATDMERNQYDLFRDLGARHGMIFGLRARSAVIGSVTLVRVDDAASPFDADARALADDLGLRAGIAIDNARLFTDTRSTAEALQRSLLPRLPASVDLELCATYVPAGHGADVGGDWYDAFELRDGATAVVLGDVVGHDLEAATRMGDMRNLLRAASLTSDDPAAVMTHFDAAIERFVPGAPATALYGRIERGAAGAIRLRWSSAGHMAPLLILPDGTTRYLDTEADAMLGVDPALPRTTHTCDLPPGAMVLLYSDGLVEDRGTGLGPGLSRLRLAAGRLAPEGAAALCDHLIEELAREADDDIAFLAVAVPAAPQAHRQADADAAA